LFIVYLYNHAIFLFHFRSAAFLITSALFRLIISTFVMPHRIILQSTSLPVLSTVTSRVSRHSVF